MSTYVDGLAYKAEIYGSIIDAAEQCRTEVIMKLPFYRTCDKTIGSYILSDYNKSSYSINSNYTIDQVI